MTKKMREHFPLIKIGRFPTRVYDLDFERDILAAE
jgi:hypothetical protein